MPVRLRRADDVTAAMEIEQRRVVTRAARPYPLPRDVANLRRLDFCARLHREEVRERINACTLVRDTRIVDGLVLPEKSKHSGPITHAHLDLLFRSAGEFKRVSFRAPLQGLLTNAHIREVRKDHDRGGVPDVGVKAIWEGRKS